MGAHLHGAKGGSGVCAYCGCRVFPAGSAEVRANPGVLATRDHALARIWRTVEPRVGTAANIVISCKACNEVKGPYPEEIFRFFLRTAGGTPLFTHLEFRKFVIGLATAGFVAAYRDAVRSGDGARQAQVAVPPVSQGRFSRRDLRRAQAGR